MKAAGWALLALALAGCSSGHNAASNQIADGKRVFQRCTACHTIGQYSTDTDGPNLYDVVDGPVAQRRPRFAYTAALQAMGGRWDAARLDAWLRAPQGLVPGTTMRFAGLSDAQQRADVIAYLATYRRDR